MDRGETAQHLVVAGDSGEAWRQRLYPVVDVAGRLCGVITRRALFPANTQGDGTASMRDLMQAPTAVTHVDQTLRHVAELMAREEVSRVPVVDREDASKVVGIVSLTQLLRARQRDQTEARERERVLRIRLVAPKWDDR